MFDKEVISRITKFAVDNSSKDDIHGFNHVERVYDMCIKIGKKLDANIDLLKITALLHDIGRIDEKCDTLKRNHAEISAEKAFNFLTSQNFNIPRDDINKIIHNIKAHSFSNNVIPQTLEAKILSDVDKLDALGAIGLYRTIGYTIKKNGGLDQVIEHLENKILKLKNLLYLSIAKKIAKERESIIYDFYKKILRKR
ncbi:MAG: HD domain-containing protein [Promethearchaeota archaeon]